MGQTPTPGAAALAEPWLGVDALVVLPVVDFFSGTQFALAVLLALDYRREPWWPACLPACLGRPWGLLMPRALPSSHVLETPPEPQTSEIQLKVHLCESVPFRTQGPLVCRCVPRVQPVCFCKVSCTITRQERREKAGYPSGRLCPATMCPPHRRRTHWKPLMSVSVKAHSPLPRLLLKLID